MAPSSNSLLLADYLIIAGFFALMLAIGCYFASRVRDSKDYFAAGKQVPWWLAGVSYWMSYFSTFTFVAHSALAYEYGFVPLTIWWMSAFLMIITAHLVAVRWRRVGTTSPVEFLEKRYSPLMRQSLSSLGSILIVLDDTLKIIAIGAVVSASFGFPVQDTILWCGLIMVTYTILGGLWAVLVTDFVQFVVMLFVILALVPLAIGQIGSVDTLIERMPSGFYRLTGGKYTTLYFAMFAIMNLLAFCTRWSLVQRFYSVKTDNDAKKICYLVAGLNIVVAPLLLLPAILAPLYLPGVQDSDSIYGLICQELLPVGMLGMLTASMLSATMSSLSSDFNVVASVLTTDVYKRLWNPVGSERHYVTVGRILTLTVGLVTVGLSLVMNSFGKEMLLFDKMVMIFVLLGPSTLLPVLAGLLFRRVSNGGAICGMILGIVFPAISRCLGPGSIEAFSGEETIPESVHMAVALVSTTFGLVLGSLFWPGTPSQREYTNRFLDGIGTRAPEIESEAVAPSSGASPALIAGVAIATLGALLVIVVLALVPFREGTFSICLGSAMFALGIIAIALPRIGLLVGKGN